MTELAASHPTQAPAQDFPVPRTCPFHPPAQYAELRATQPISRVTLKSGRTAWLLTRHEDVQKMLLSPGVSTNRAHPAFPLFADIPREQLNNVAQALIGEDPPVHTAQRRLLIPEFTVKRMQSLHPRIQQIVDEYIDTMLAGDKPADLVKALSLPVPSLVICELLGVPYSDHEFFQTHTKKLVTRSTSAQDRRAAQQELRAYFDRLVTAKEADPSEEDLLGRLIIKNSETGTMDHERLVSTALILLIAGHETTANMISLGTVALLENPDQLAELKADPSLATPAIEELLRLFSIADQVTSRVVTQDLEIGGVTIPAGDGVIGLNAAANHDPEMFAEPEKLDIHRGGRHHVAFGYGIHQCLGQNLARLELEIVFNTLFAKAPNLALAMPVDELPYKDDAVVYGIHELPVTW